jgi:glycosyltransferase involved in cell wall biosynthesis
MKTIAFITRVHPQRPVMLKVCIESIKAQTSDDYIHILSRDDKTKNGYGRFLANKSFSKISPINARYVMAIDDDDMIIDPDFVKIVREIVNKNNPEIIFFKNIISGHVYPWPGFWKKPPVLARIGGSCFAIRLDIWEKYIHEFGKKSCGDFSFISICYKNTKNHFWLDRIVAKTQRKAGFGQGEDEHA